MNYKVDLLSIHRGTVVAPAGCGKTQLIADALKRYQNSKPILVLTHTNAGVAALRGRLENANVSSKNYRIHTIDGWAMRLISMFPQRSGHDPEILFLSDPRSNYPAIRSAAWQLLKSGHISDILKASYAHLIVDEYQDCSISQHKIVAYAAKVLPTCVLGDPLQSIFNFGEPLPDWNTQVCKYFPIAAELITPWRWDNVGKGNFGRWLLSIREPLLSGGAIDFNDAPVEVNFIQLDGKNNSMKRRFAASTKSVTPTGGVIVIGESTSPPSQHLMASQTPGGSTVESVDLKDLILFGRTFKPESEDALERLLDFATSVMTNVEAKNVITRVASLASDKAKKSASAVEQVALEFLAKKSYQGAVQLLRILNTKSSTRVYRPTIFRSCLKALQTTSSSVSFYDSIIHVREQNRLLGRPLPKRAVGSTLLMKGLEAEVAVILNADALNAKNIYVAMTRGSMKLVVCASNSIISPNS